MTAKHQVQTVAGAVTRELTALASSTPPSQIAIAMANSLDSVRSSMAVAGTARALREVMTALRQRSPRQADGLSER